MGCKLRRFDTSPSPFEADRERAFQAAQVSPLNLDAVLICFAELAEALNFFCPNLKTVLPHACLHLPVRCTQTSRGFGRQADFVIEGCIDPTEPLRLAANRQATKARSATTPPAREIRSPKSEPARRGFFLGIRASAFCRISAFGIRICPARRRFAFYTGYTHPRNG